MPALRKDDRIPMSMGGFATVVGDKPLGSGAQGEVYIVEYKGARRALKWYISSKIKENDEFRKNLVRNAEAGPPSPYFVWPIDVSLPYKGGYGYVMELFPKGNELFSDFLRTYRMSKDKVPVKIPVRFKEFDKLVLAGIRIVDSFSALHRTGKSYQDLNDGGISMNLDTGEILICDCDNIAADGTNFGIAGKQGYMAPEIVLNRNRPNVYSDRFSMAVILFKLFFRDDPFCGAKVCACCNLTDANYRRFYGEEPVFLFDPNDDSNRPVKGVSDNVIRMWANYPQFIRDLFLRAFVDGLRDPPSRPIETEWISALCRFRATVVRCDCGSTSFFQGKAEDGFACPKCGRRHPVLALNGLPVVLTRSTVLYRSQTREGSEDNATVSARVVENRNHPGVLGFKNFDDVAWEAAGPDGAFKAVAPGNAVPIRAGMDIRFDRKTRGVLIWRKDDGE
ncbi:MAG: hypothetical protein IKP53_03630 [Candidatus Methanomethylophilaceae archaeon]|nr:hypothetical protein [Candidatus Methanomethylophilaceae archaeon]